MLKKKPPHLIFWYFWTNLAFLLAFCNLDQKSKVGYMCLIWQNLKFPKDPMKEYKMRVKTFPGLFVSSNICSQVQYECSPLPWSSQNFYMLLKYCIFIKTLLTYIGLMWWIGHGQFRLVFVDEIFHKLRRHSVDMLLLYMFNLSRLCFISHFTLFHR